MRTSPLLFTLDMGERKLERWGTDFNAYALRTSDAPWFDAGLDLRKSGKRYKLAITQHHHSMEGRDLVRSATFAEFVKNPSLIKEKGHTPSPEQTLYDNSLKITKPGPHSGFVFH